MRRVALAAGVMFALCGVAWAETWVVTPEPPRPGETLLPQGEVEWGYYCLRCHESPESLRAQIAAASADRTALETRRWLGVFLLRHHAPTPEIAVALAAWLAPDPE